ncbi:hypothetical protein SEMRO_1852_G301700.1 [Seminavis robusta]|uniref:Uncharacterized protein n=1 Tax=Seminavis robusta TaxID=568900 RepID=A0A9N8HXR3_9STRA|nr:hypothetical protein SEMRO_1852_G301700.1 [Seminavis robusta]|eukprot:Sro1852_g301700.1 n/a (115) ;mRNA; r:4551-4895
MSARQLSLSRGKNGPVQAFSTSRAVDPVVAQLLQRTLQPGMNTNHRQQVLSDPGNVFQFACVWNEKVGLITRPTIVTNSQGAAMVVGDFTDSIGEPHIAQMPLYDFFGFVTTLV